MAGDLSFSNQFWRTHVFTVCMPVDSSRPMHTRLQIYHLFSSVIPSSNNRKSLSKVTFYTYIFNIGLICPIFKFYFKTTGFIYYFFAKPIVSAFILLQKLLPLYLCLCFEKLWKRIFNIHYFECKADYCCRQTTKVARALWRIY